MVRVLADGRGLVKLSPLQTRVANGLDDLSTWTDAELEYGAKRVKGRFQNKPKVIAAAVHDELVRRKMTKAFESLKESVHDAVALLREVMTDDEADPALRVRVRRDDLDRVLGNPRRACW